MTHKSHPEAGSPRAGAQRIVQHLHGAGFAAFWVGGCVRDFLLGREPEDFDIATDAPPAEVEKLFAKTIPVGRKFGVIVVVEQGRQFQVATFRAEAEYRDGRRPERVVFANAQADASRRDFTVNGLFFDPLTNQIHDWVAAKRICGLASSAPSARRPNALARIICGCCGPCGLPRGWALKSSRPPSRRSKHWPRKSS